MRVDKFLKVSRIVKRRTVANEMAAAGRVNINGKRAKPGTEVAIGDIIEIGFGERQTKIKVTDIKQSVKKEEAETLYQLLS
ncbi:MAG: RNA-binding S4 domain-containing protein [Clostridiaceae bacterium]|jgi:ribosomal 50S subunit-recycling heat shock protein|nr:RNA-binding S4 domain-containing protein [Clostridiaceae bacterium]